MSTATGASTSTTSDDAPPRSGADRSFVMERKQKAGGIAAGLACSRNEIRVQSIPWRPPCGGRLGAGGVHALGDAGRLAAAIAQIIELGAPDLAAPHDLDRIDHRRIDREDALDALAVGDLADGEALVEAAAVAGDADALIGLDAGALAFRDLDVDDDGVAGLEIRDLGAGHWAACSASICWMMFMVDTPAVTSGAEHPGEALRRAVFS